MNTFRNLYPKIFDYENLLISFENARKDKKMRSEVLRFGDRLEEGLISLQNDLIYQSYQVGQYREKIATIPKKRLILILPFRDRIVQWAIYRNVYPLYEPIFIDTSYGSVKGKGSLLAAQKLQYWLRMHHNKSSDDLYVLKMDIAKFFFRVPHDVLMRVISRKIKDKKLLWLFETIIRNDQTPFGFPLEVIDVETTERLWNIGMPVGNLVSQLLANIIMNELDQYVKHELKVQHYMRYMDDMLVLGTSKADLHAIRDYVADFLFSELGLNLNKKTSVRKASFGIEFAGYRIWRNKLQIRKSTTLRIKRNLAGVKHKFEKGKISHEKAQRVLQSYLGMLSHCTNDALRDKILEDFAVLRHDLDDII